MAGFARNIADGFQDVFKGKLAWNAGEVAEGVLKRDITQMSKNSSKYYEAEARRLAKSSGVQIDSSVYSKIRKGQDVGDQDDAINDIIGKATTNVDDKLSGLKNRANFDADGKFVGARDKGIVASGYADDIKGSIPDSIDYYSKAAKAYFNTPGKRGARIGAAAGAYAAGAVGIRLMDGGSLTRNSSGERDIAGIPFF